MPSVFETHPIDKSSITEMQKIGALVGELESTLVAQRQLLQQRGMSLPPGTLTSLSNIQADIVALTSRLNEQLIELNRLHALAETSALINSSLGLDEVLNRVMDTVIALTGAERGYIMLREEESGELIVQVARNLDKETLEQSAFIVSRSVANKVAETGDPIVTTNAQSDPRFAHQESVVSYSLRSILCAPLQAKGRITGVVYADNRIRTGLFGESELRMLVGFANQAAVAIENARLFERAKATLIEITENKELLENVFASIASGVITMDRAGHVVIFNHAAEKIFDVDSERVLNQPLREAIPALPAEAFKLARRVLDETVRESLEIQPEIAPRGQTVLDLRLSPLKTVDQETHGVTILVNDLTEIRRREATLAEVRRYLPPAMVENIRTIDNIELGGEDREISVVFADVRGFTSFSERLEPEELMTIINRYLSVASDAIHLYEGIIDKYIGDAVVGIYNTQINPQPDDHTLRAIRAAMSMIYDVQALHEVLPEELRLWYGIGIDTGMAVLGNVGSEERKEFTALGQPVDYAKKLQETAEHGEIIISEATYQRVHDRIEAEKLERAFRGETEKRVMYRVLGFRRKRG